MRLRLDEASLPNLPPPPALGVNQGLPPGPYDAAPATWRLSTPWRARRACNCRLTIRCRPTTAA
jgi:hypothetical protein